MLGEEDVGGVGDGGERGGREPGAVRPVRLPDLHDQHEAGQRQREGEPDAPPNLLAVDEACPEPHQDRSDELDHERDPDRDAVDGEEVRPLHERETADAEDHEERELTAT